MAQPYNYQEAEERIYQMWEEGGYFTPKMDPNKTPFVIVLGPPNASGAMHLGNAFSLVLQDVLIRYHRMKGESTLFLPGTDHGGYETQITYEQELEHQGKSSSDLTRKELYKKLSLYVQNNNEIIRTQLKRLGASVDWTRFHFTLDKKAVQNVYAIFQKLEQDGLIARNKRKMNYCPKCGTTLQDIEVEVQDTIRVCKAGHAIETKELPIWCVLVDAPQKSLKRPVINAVKTGEIEILPLGKEKTIECIESIQDWYIARQNVWGIRIPVWYEVTDPSLFTLWFFDKNKQRQGGTLKELLEKGFSWGEIEKGLQRVQAPENATYVLEEREKKDGISYLPETDTFDTWFSSVQWRVTTLKYSELDFAYFYPTAVRVCGQDLLYKSVSRDIMLTYYITGKPSFSKVYLHHLVLGTSPNKMSKSLRNAEYPEPFIQQFGADVLRMVLISCAKGSKDIPLSEINSFAEYQAFIDRLWQIGQNLDKSIKKLKMGVTWYSQKIDERIQDKDKEILSKLNMLVNSVSEYIEKMQISNAQGEIVTFVQRKIEGTYIRHIKKRYDQDVALSVLRYVYLTCIKLLHPFIPFITEEIYGILVKRKKPLIVSAWPQKDKYT